MGTDTRLGGRVRTRINAQVRARRLPCPMCGLPIDQALNRRGKRDPLCSVIDEWLPRSRGGQVNTTNCVELHDRCNQIKADHWPITPDLHTRCRNEINQLIQAPGTTLERVI